MNSPRIINIINFIRGVEPRYPDLDLLEPVRNQVRLVRQHRLPATWLLQYDALIDERFVNLLKGLDETHDIGAWLEFVQPQVEKAGLKWRGRKGFSWDWHSDVGFSVGYTPAEREKLVDVYMEEFQRVFGCYPASVGSWFMDAHTMGYLADRYGAAACCICKDQVGTDGYTLWGGYYGQAYYPSRANAFMPAQNEEASVPLPVFRMLGSDPIYQYDLDAGKHAQGVVTLEPAIEEGGGSPEWVRWFFDLNFNAPCLAFAYAQVGQENSFGWKAMAEGLTDQIGLAAEMARRGEVRVETLVDSGHWFRRVFPETPATAITALGDWQGQGRKSVWYCSRFYRVNLFWEREHFRIRDIHLFDQNYPERYLTNVCTSPNAVYDTLPVLDGFLWSGSNVTAGIRPVQAGADGALTALATGAPQVKEGTDTLRILMPLADEGSVQVACRPDCLVLEGPAGVPWALEMSWDAAKQTALTGVVPDALRFSHEGFDYTVPVLAGMAERRGESASVLLKPGSSGRLSLGFGR